MSTPEIDTRPTIDLLARKSKILTKGDRLREVSTDEQIKQGRKWAADNGYRVRFEWVELGSAYNPARERKTFDKAMKALLNGETSALWVYMLDRFSRKGAEDVLKVIGKARVIFDYDRLDSMDERDRGRIIDEAERARAYSVRLSHRVKDVKTSQRDAGEWLGGSTPWGLNVDPKTRKVSPDDTPVTLGATETRGQRARRMVLALAFGVSGKALATELNRDGIPSPRGSFWSSGPLLRLLQSPAYMGLQGFHNGKRTLVYRNEKGETVSIGEGVVTPEEVEAARYGVAMNHSTLGATRHPGWNGGNARHLLSDISWCVGCGRAASCKGDGYVCGSTINGGRPCPAPVRANTKALESYVTGAWLAVVSALEPTDELAATIAERWAALSSPEETEEYAAAKAAHKRAQAALARLEGDRRAGYYDGPAEALYGPARREALTALMETQARVDELVTPTVHPGFLSADDDALRAMWDAAPLPLRRDLLRLAIDRIDIRKAGYQGQRFDGDARVTITWAKPNGDDD
ncbi:recombinase family protein [Streptacidiphilus sp. P02-A3a]|uniref:recombinase family protein n=1 Tax=Streptacidiphilus sp. P02-A3a TaxID=2704468 RepID=UPI0015F84F68|nr:recombinase family protein [Streptacidiphilus sp. P02-A3a]QMU72150.1 recombinase family protein [Streptacidiphilus sp. P02-A3a]